VILAIKCIYKKHKKERETKRNRQKRRLQEARIARQNNYN